MDKKIINKDNKILWDWRNGIIRGYLNENGATNVDKTYYKSIKSHNINKLG